MRKVYKYVCALIKMPKEEKICNFCKNKIEEKAKHVQIATHHGNGKQHNDWFHWNCWLAYFKRCVLQKSSSVVKKAGGLASKVLGLK